MKTKLSSSGFDCDCQFPINRRAFLKTTVGGVAAAATGCVSVTKEEKVERVAAVPAKVLDKAKSETLVTTLHKSLIDEQRKAVAFPFDHELRSKVDNNWHIVDKKIGEFFDKEQQEMIRQIFLDLHSPEYAE